MDDTDLESILNSDTSTEAPAPAAPDQSGQPRDEHGRFAQTDQTGDNGGAVDPAAPAAPPAAPQDAETGHIPVAALKDERQKRQQAEEQLRRYEGYFQALQQQQQPQQQAPQAPDPNVDFAGWLNWRDQQIASQIRDHIMGEVQQQASQFGTMTRAQVGEMMARQRHQDYDEKIGILTDAAAANPFLVHEIANAPDPAEHAYKLATNIHAARELSSTTAPTRDAIEAEIRQKIMTELGLPATPTAPSSLVSERSVGSRSGPAWAGPTPLSEIFSR